MTKILLLTFIIITTAFTQNQDSSAVVDTSFNLNPGTVLLKSVLVPGLGQVSQERLWQSAFFYSMSLTYYYQSVIAYLKYKDTSQKKYLYRFQNKISIAAFIHILNIIDAYDSAYRQNVKGWNGLMFSDKPLKSPWGAALRSAIFPGWGQWYNEKYIKSVVYLGLTSYVGYKVYKNNQDYRATGLNKYIDSRRRYSWYLGLTYLVMLTDAYVDAYLYKFDETIDLTIPVTFNNDTAMIGLLISF